MPLPLTSTPAGGGSKNKDRPQPPTTKQHIAAPNPHDPEIEEMDAESASAKRDYSQVARTNSESDSEPARPPSQNRKQRRQDKIVQLDKDDIPQPQMSLLPGRNPQRPHQRPNSPLPQRSNPSDPPGPASPITHPPTPSPSSPSTSTADLRSSQPITTRTSELYLEIVKTHGEILQELQGDTRITVARREVIFTKLNTILKLALDMNINQAILETELAQAKNTQSQSNQVQQILEKVTEIASTTPPAPEPHKVQSNRQDFPPLTYAGAASNPSKVFQAPLTSHSIVVRPASGSTTNDMRTEVQKALNPRQTGLQIEGIRTTDKVEIIIRAPSEKVQKQIQEKLSPLPSVHAAPLGKREPLVAVYGVPHNLTPEELVTAVHNQNFPEVPPSDFAKDFQPKFKFGPKNQDVEHWAVAVTPTLRNTLRSLERIYVDYRSAQIKDFLSITRCLKCAGMGHHAAKYLAPHVSLRCGSSSHKEQVCNNPTICIPCRRRGQTCANAGERECVSYQLALKALIARTNYE